MPPRVGAPKAPSPPSGCAHQVEQNHARGSASFFLPLSLCLPLHFVIQHSETELRLQIPEQERGRSGRFRQAASNVAVALSTPGPGARGMGESREGTAKRMLGTASVIAGLPVGERSAAAIPIGANLLLLLLSPMLIRLQLQTSFVQEGI